MKRLHPFVYEYDFPYHDYLLKNHNFFDKIYNEKIDQIKLNKGFNVNFHDDVVHPFLYEKLHKLIDENFYLTPTFQSPAIGIYKQTHKDSTSLAHCHILHHSISTVFYLNPPQKGEGGQIKFYGISLNDTLTIQPEPNKLYVFPGWLFHLPLPQTTSTPRFSFNWGHYSITRPIHKITGNIW